MLRPATTLVVAILLTSAGLAACGDDEADPTGAEAVSDRASEDGGPAPEGAQASEGGQVSEGAAERDDPEPAEPALPEPDVQVVELTFAGGQVTSGAGRVAVEPGRAVRLEVTSDVDEEVHVHGYDLEVPVAAGSTATIELVADLPGVWEVELHDSGQLLCELEIAG